MVLCTRVYYRVNSGKGGSNKDCTFSFCHPYCSEMNLIGTEWYQLKSHEIVDQMLPYAVMEGMKARTEVGE